MTEKGILMSTAMVKALIYDKTKTYTRRTSGLEKVNDNPDNWNFVYEEMGDFYFEPLDKSCIATICKPRYAVKDVLWIRETHYTSLDKKVFYGYVADGDHPHNKPYIIRPSLFMFKDFTRHNRFEVLSVIPHRVQEISDAEAKLEGFQNRLEFAETIERLNPKSKPWSRNLWVWAYGLREIL